MSEIRFTCLCRKYGKTIKVEITLPLYPGEDYESLTRDIEESLAEMDLNKYLAHIYAHEYKDGNLVTIWK